VHATYVGLWRWVFVLALALELPLIVLATAKGKRLRAAGASLIGNAVTHPALWFLWPRLLPYGAALVVGELAAVILEGASLAVIGGLGRRRGFLLSLAVNAYSYALGELVMRKIGPALIAFWYR
jgi:hypothetical protein